MQLLGYFIALLVTHWIGDFVLQTNWQATHKSENNFALASHVGTYMAVIGVAMLVLFGVSTVTLSLIGLNGICHFCTDYVTSRITARFRAKQDWHNFFVMIGFDQLIHQGTLAATVWVISALAAFTN